MAAWTSRGCGPGIKNSYARRATSGELQRDWFIPNDLPASRRRLHLEARMVSPPYSGATGTPFQGERRPPTQTARQRPSRLRRMTIRWPFMTERAGCTVFSWLVAALFGSL
jgi:hypothetical protein